MISAFMNKIKSIFLHGLFTIFPITATVVIIHFGYTLIAGWVAPLRMFVPPQLAHVPAVEFGMVIGFILIVGTLLRFFIVGSVVKYAEQLINQLPLVRVIYSSSKILVDFFNVPNPTTAEKTVVLVQFPRKGCYNLAFLLDSAQKNFQPLLPKSEQDQEYFKVFMPNSPNPTSGFFLIVRRDEIVDTDISFEDAIKTIVSCGIHTPEVLGGPKTPPEEPVELE